MRTKCYVLSLVGIMLLFALSSDAGEMRTWTRKNGKTFEAEFVSFTKGTGVTVKGKDGNEFVVKMGQLSEEDRSYVREMSAKSREQAKPAEQTTTAAMRTWTKSDGTTIEAGYVSFEERTTKGGKLVRTVTLKKPDGSPVALRLHQLSEADKEYLAKYLLSQGKTASWYPKPTQPSPPSPQPTQPAAAKSEPASVPAKPETTSEPAKPEPQTAAKPVESGADPGKRTMSQVDNEKLKERLERMKDADVLLRRILKGFPANCVVAQVVGTPKPVKQDDQKVTVRVTVKLGVDEKALAVFRKRLLAVLEEFKEDGWDESWAFEQTQQRPPQVTKDAVWAETEYARVTDKDADKKGGKAATEEITVYVQTGRDDAWTRLEWKVFALDQMLANVFDDSTGRHGECMLSIVSKAGDTIPLDRFTLDDERLGGTTPLADRSKYGDGGRTFFISPTFLRDADCCKHAPSVTVVRDVEIPESLLDRLAALKCEMRYVAGSNGRK